MRPLITLAAVLIAPAMLVAGCDARSTSSTVAVRKPVIRLSAAPEGPAAGYLTLSASKDHVALVSISSPKADRIEMHETMSSGSMTSMRALARIDVRYGEIVFAPGGRHLMLFGVDSAIKPGDEIPLVLQFSNKGVAAVSARVIGPGDELPD